MTKDGLLFTSTAPRRTADILKYGPGNILPDVHTDPVDVDTIGHQAPNYRLPSTSTAARR